MRRRRAIRMRPYLDFYRANAISPVRQDISELKKHFDRREALYRHLRIAPGLLKGQSVIEFGPGSGHNAIYTSSLEPKHYVLVDGNEVGLKDLKKTLEAHRGGTTRYEVHASLIEEYEFGSALRSGAVRGRNSLSDPAERIRQTCRQIREARWHSCDHHNRRRFISRRGNPTPDRVILD